jgi:hypothetical protein
MHDFSVPRRACPLFLGQFLWIAGSMDPAERHNELWDEEEGSFYDLLRLPDGSSIRLKVPAAANPEAGKKFGRASLLASHLYRSRDSRRA